MLSNLVIAAVYLTAAGAEKLCPNGSNIPPFHLQYLHAHDLEAFSSQSYRENYKELLPQIFGTLIEWFGPQTETALTTFSTKRGNENDFRWCAKLDMNMGHHEESVYTSAVAPYLNDAHDYYAEPGTSSDVLYHSLRSDEFNWNRAKFDDSDLRVVRIISFATDKLTDVEGSYTSLERVNYANGAREDCNIFDFPSKANLIQSVNDFPSVNLIFHTTSENTPDLDQWYANQFAKEMLDGLVPVISREISNEPLTLLDLILEQVQSVVCVEPVVGTCEDNLDSLVQLIASS